MSPPGRDAVTFETQALSSSSPRRRFMCRVIACSLPFHCRLILALHWHRVGTQVLRLRVVDYERAPLRHNRREKMGRELVLKLSRQCVGSRL